MRYFFVNIGQPSSRDDAGIWGDYRPNGLVTKELLNLPISPGGTIQYHFVEDDTFPQTIRIS